MCDLVSSFNWSESDYSNVLFFDVPLEYYSHETIVCSLEIFLNVPRSSDDYVGLYRVGFKDIHEHLAVAKITDNGSTKLIITLNIEQLLPSSDDFYQFLYVGKNNTVHGASTPFIIKTRTDVEQAHNSSIDDDYVVVEHPDAGEVENSLLSMRDQVARRLNDLDEENTRLKEELERKSRFITKISQEFEGFRQSKDEELLRFSQDMEQQAQKERKVYEEKLVSCTEQIGNLIKQLEDLNVEKDNLSSEMDELLLKYGKLHHSMDKQMEKTVETLTFEMIKQNQQPNMVAAAETSDSLENVKSLLEATEASRQLCLEELRNQKFDLNTQLEGMKEENEHLKNIICSLEIKLKQSEEKLQGLEEDMKFKMTKLQKREEDEYSTVKQLEEVMGETCSLKKQANSFQTELLKAAEKLEKAEARNDRERRKVKYLEGENLKIMMKLDSEKMDNHSLSLQIAKLKEQFAKVSIDFAECEVLKEKLQLDLEKAKDENFQIMIKLDAEKILSSGLKSQVDNLNEELLKANSDISDLQKKSYDGKESAEESLKKLKTELADAKKRLEDASELYKAQYIEILGLRKQLHQDEKKKTEDY